MHTLGGKESLFSLSAVNHRNRFRESDFRGSRGETKCDERDRNPTSKGADRYISRAAFSVSWTTDIPGIEEEGDRSVDIMHWIRHKCTLGANWPGFPRFVLHLSLERATASFSSIPQADARTWYHGHKSSFLYRGAKWMPTNLGYYANALVNKARQHSSYSSYSLPYMFPRSLKVFLTSTSSQWKTYEF